jgi:hypothetical protein
MADFHMWLLTVFSNPTLASWLQAFAAVVALGISVWATWRVGSAERRRDLLQARGIAVAIYPELQKLKVTVSDIQGNLEQFRMQASHLVGQSVAANIQGLAQISMPPMIDRNIDKLFMLGKVAGPSCLQLVGMLFQYNTFVDQLTGGMMSMNAQQWTDAVPHLEDHLALIDRIIEKCEHEVRPIHDAIKG